MYSIKNGKLTMSRFFNSPIVIPDGIKHVKMGWSFNSNIILPHSIKILEFGWVFNKNIILPESLRTLIMCWNFNKEIILPKKLVYIKVGRHYTQNININTKIVDISLCPANTKISMFSSNITTLILSVYLCKTLLNIFEHINLTKIIIKQLQHSSKNYNCYKVPYGTDVIMSLYKMQQYK